MNLTEDPLALEQLANTLTNLDDESYIKLKDIIREDFNMTFSCYTREQ